MQKYQRGDLTLVERNGLIEIWLPPLDQPEGECLIVCHPDYVKDLIAVLTYYSTVKTKACLRKFPKKQLS